MNAEARKWQVVSGASRTDTSYCDFCGVVAKATVRMAAGTIPIGKTTSTALICAACVSEVNSAMIQDAARAP